MRATTYQRIGDRYRYRTLLLKLPDFADDAGTLRECLALRDALRDDANPEESDGARDSGKAGLVR